MKLPSFVVCLACIFLMTTGTVCAQRKPTYYIWNGANLQPAYDDPSNMKIDHWEAWLYVGNAATGEWRSTSGRWGSWSEKTIEKLTYAVKTAQASELALKKWCVVLSSKQVHMVQRGLSDSSAGTRESS